MVERPCVGSIVTNRFDDRASRYLEEAREQSAHERKSNFPRECRPEYPVIVMRYTMKNTSDRVQETSIAGWVENFSNWQSSQENQGVRLSRYSEQDRLSAVECWASPVAADNRPERTEVFADCEAGDYGDWEVEGKAFGDAPAQGSRTIQTLSGFKGKGLVNSWTGTDKLQRKLTSPQFKIEKPFLVDLENNLGETTNLAAVNPQVVERLLGLAESMREDLGDYDRVGNNMRFFDPLDVRPTTPPVPITRKQGRRK